MIWVQRIALLIIFLTMSYIALLPGFHFDAWVPESLMHSIGLSKTTIALVTSKWDKLAHFMGAFLIIILGFGSVSAKWKSCRLVNATRSGVYALVLVSCLALATEIAQLNIGRQFSIEDIMASAAGACLALACLPLRSKVKVHIASEKINRRTN